MRNETNNDEFIMKPKVDFCFKQLMEDEEIRESFICAVLGVQEESIQKTILMPTHLHKDYADDKLGILDVCVVLENGTQIDMEIQLTAFAYWVERSLFYMCKMYVDQIHKGEDYDVLRKCIHVGILDFILFDEYEEYASCFHIWEDQRKQKYTDKLEIHVLELPKLSKYEYPETALLNWVKFINAETKEELKMLAKNDDSLEKAYEKLVNISADKEKRLEYEERQKALRDYNSQIKSNWKTGHKIGRAEGVMEMCREFGLSKEETVIKIKEKFSVTEEEAKQYVEDYWDRN